MSMDDRTRILPGRTETGVGTQLSGIYELDERIASGGMGEVYRGHNIQTGDLVAIKIVLPEFARDPTILSLFRKEASILNHLSHEAIVRYHVFTVDPAIGRPYLAMEYVDGPSLFDVMRQGPMAQDEVRRLCHRLASGLNAVHRAGAIHRDLSPDNVILPGGRVEHAKIIDFGIARAAHIGGETLIGGRFAGKYNYVSPEQLGLHGGEVNERSDIYSLGLILAAALRGSPLDMTGSQVDVVEKRRSVPDLTGIEGEMRPVIEAMLQPDPRDRPGSMAEIVRLSRGASQVGPVLEPDDAEEDWDDEARAARPWKDFGRRDLPAGGEAGGSEDQARFVEHVRPAYMSRPKPAPARAMSPGIRRRGLTGTGIAGLFLALAIVAAVGAYATFDLVLAPPPPVSHEGQATLIPDRARPREQAAATRPAAPAATDRIPVTSLPQPTMQAKPALEPAEPQRVPAGPKPDSAAPGSGLPASEIIKTFMEQAKRKPPETEPTEPAAPRAEPDKADPANTGSGKFSSGAPSPAAIASASSKTASPVPPQKDAASVKPLEADAANAGVQPAASEQPSGETKPPLAGSEGKTPSAGPAAAKANKTLPVKPAHSVSSAASDLVLANAKQQSASEGASPKPDGPGRPGAAATAVTAGTVAATSTAPGASQQKGGAGPADGAVVAMNIPHPDTPGVPSGMLEKTVAWLRAFPGGDCFYALADDVTAKPIRIVGFGAATEPFEKLMKAFESAFGSEPDVQVRLIAPAQCAVARFMRGFGKPARETQSLTLDRTSVPNGSPISGVLRTRGGLRSSLLLIDQDGMTYNLDRLLIVSGDTAKFNARIQLDSVSSRNGRPMPEIVLAITGAVDIEAASLPQPAPAQAVLPQISDEIRRSGADFSVTAKYFQLGGG
ncbi:MAG: serine/threonine protein kinase [Rhizobiaceae bacterium]|nr:MAG: serine/threonine protein kinase [Rhizobiaceae bacterium]